MATRNKLTRIEARKADQPSSPGAGLSKRRIHPDGKAPLLQLDKPYGSWHVDDVLKIINDHSTFEDGFDLPALRRSLSEGAAMAHARAETDYVIWEQSRDRQAVIDTVAAFIKVMPILENDRIRLEHFMGKYPVEAGNSAPSDLKELEKISLLCQSLRPLLEKNYANIETEKGDASKPEYREYFQFILDWWGENVRGGWRGEATCQEKLAVALWRDLWLSSSPLKNPEEWAKAHFRPYRRKA
ncbi:hypothetical protein HFO09_14110 [Rhizobium laguerreae]|uniref:hypothetical protein n=1 Tax=Rhizobium laguerreae TaxID=1076926 RepID=UPI001C920B4C|nr:hypothetical protein [Rhizobium laguerreae]MBY3254542.1 hypothetical protein [Rhizobium laguerreae]MBY3283859.1 hypothetical protein [Rhizobium laguerreae]MBY3290201.1 hypothetical protein [Rhizobium laguerreae]